MLLQLEQAKEAEGPFVNRLVQPAEIQTTRTPPPTSSTTPRKSSASGTGTSPISTLVVVNKARRRLRVWSAK